MYSSEKKSSWSWFTSFDWFSLYPISAGILFVCVGWVISIMYETICEEFTQKELTNKDINWKYELVKLKRHYFMILDLVDQLENCFGLFLLILITGNFCRMITSSFQIMICFRKHEWLNSAKVLYELTVMLLHFCPIVYIPQRIRQKVNIFLNCLMQPQFLNSHRFTLIFRLSVY